MAEMLHGGFTGATHTDKGFPWVQVGVEPYTTKKGERIYLRVWKAHCVSCHEPFRIKVADRLFGVSNEFERRRCTKCVKERRK